VGLPHDPSSEEATHPCADRTRPKIGDCQRVRSAGEGAGECRSRCEYDSILVCVLDRTSRPSQCKPAYAYRRPTGGALTTDLRNKKSGSQTRQPMSHRRAARTCCISRSVQSVVRQNSASCRCALEPPRPPRRHRRCVAVSEIILNCRGNCGAGGFGSGA
jgi:hypothetical protein